MIRMQISVISLMILLSPWLCSSSVVNMSCSTREFGKCVKTQLQLVCSNYGSREFITISLLIKRDFLIWINTAHKGMFERSEAELCTGRMPMMWWEVQWVRSSAGVHPRPVSSRCRAGTGKPPVQGGQDRVAAPGQLVGSSFGYPSAHEPGR